ncbi:hypothetical protein DOY81_003724, partial [Sarcophaga bullata]
FAMKTFQLNVAKSIAIIYCASIGIEVVSGTLEKHTASDGREYLIETEYQYNWFEALNECTRRDSQLVIIDSEEKNTVITDLLKKVVGKSRDLWLGGNDEYNINKERPFFWSTTGQNFKFTYWADGEPTNGGSIEHCVHIWQETQYRWNDLECDAKLGFICEDNQYMETCNNKLKTDCDSIYKHELKDNMMQLNTRLQTLKQVLQNINESAVQKLIDQQELIAKNLWEKFQKQGNELNEQIAQSMEQINASIPTPYPFKNVVIIKQ